MELIDLTGQKFGRLTVIKKDVERCKNDRLRVKNKEIKCSKVFWLCKCDCGKNELISVSGDCLTRGSTNSCGCYRDEINKNMCENRYKKSFEQWCIENNHKDYLELWDYDLNDKLPNQIGSKSTQKFYFKCPSGIHKSEIKKINSLTKHNINKYNCFQCNSFAQWGIDNICSDFLEKYWDYDRNNLNPWEITFGSIKKIFIKCQEKDYHGSYETTASIFNQGCRCNFCSSKNIHILDSLGSVYPRVFEVWSDKNKKSPYELSLGSDRKFWFKCQNDIHEDYKRSVVHAIESNFCCPECGFSKGENKISEILLKNNVNYDYQYKFIGLLGVNGGLLSYDFYLKSYNLLIEYQGEFHDGTAKMQTEEDFETQQEHDRRKREYAKEHNIKLLEIWYWDFDNIEETLKKELK